MNRLDYEASVVCVKTKCCKYSSGVSKPGNKPFGEYSRAIGVAAVDLTTKSPAVRIILVFVIWERMACKLASL